MFSTTLLFVRTSLNFIGSIIIKITSSAYVKAFEKPLDIIMQQYSDWSYLLYQRRFVALISRLSTKLAIKITGWFGIRKFLCQQGLGHLILCTPRNLYTFHSLLWFEYDHFNHIRDHSAYVSANGRCRYIAASFLIDWAKTRSECICIRVNSLTLRQWYDYQDVSEAILTNMGERITGI